MSDSSSHLQAVHVFHYLLAWMSCGVLRGFCGSDAYTAAEPLYTYTTPMPSLEWSVLA